MKIIKSTLITILFCINALAQQPDAGGYELFDAIGYTPQIPPSPEAANLGRYGNIDVNLAYGRPNVSIPLFTAKSSDLEIPFSLNYNASGNRVADEGSWFGLGWTLTGTNVISRTVRGELDDRAVINAADDDWFYSNPYDLDKILATISGTIDTQPDIFNYSCGQYSGQFVIGKDDEIVMMPWHPIEIIPTFDMGYLKSFQINTQKNQYIYDKIEMTEVRRPKLLTNIEPYVSSWYLSQIKSKSTKEEITFEYADKGYIERDIQKVQAMEYKSASGLNYQGGGTKSFYTALKIDHEWRLSKVNFKNGYASIYHSGIDIYTNDQIVKRIKWKRQGFANSSDCLTNQCNRIKLSEVVVDDKKYNLEYNEDYDEPPLNSYDVDHWGYFNNANNSSSIPDIKFFGFTYGGGADRNVKPDASQMFILQKIIYPTGGATEFEYESNSYVEFDQDGKTKYEVYQTSNYLLNHADAPNPDIDVTYHETYDFPESTNVIFDVDNSVPADDVTWYDEFSEVTVEYGSKLKDYDGGDSWDVYDMKAHPRIMLNWDGINSPHQMVFTDQYDRAYVDPTGTLEIRQNTDYVNFGRETIEGSVFILTASEPENYTKLSVKRRGYITVEPDPSFERLVGGLRVKKITNKDEQGTILSEKSYRYISTSTGHTSGFLLTSNASQLEDLTSYFTTKYYQINTIDLGDCAGHFTCICDPLSQLPYTMTIHDNAVGNLGGGDPIGYTEVTESNLINGQIENQTHYKFHMEKDLYTYEDVPIDAESKYIHSEAWIPKSSRSSWRGDLLSRSIFDKEGNLINTVTNEYYPYYNLGISMKASYISIADYMIKQCRWESESVDNYIISNYNHLSLTERRVKRTTKEDYFNNETVKSTVTTDYTYDQYHPVPQEITTFNNNETIKKTYTYDYEISGGTVYDGANPYSLIEEKVEVDDLVVGARKFEYYYDQIRKIFLWEGAIPVSDFKDYITDSNLDDQYHPEPKVSIDYYEFGKPKSKTENGTITSYIWGYQNEYLLATLISQEELDLDSFIEKIALLSDTDVDRTMDIVSTDDTITYVGSEGSLRQELKELRINFPKAQVTSYTYDPLVGITSVTDSNSIVHYYQYDAYGRLYQVLDENEHILKEHQYNYVNK